MDPHRLLNGVAIKVSIVIPVRNEASNLKWVLDRIPSQIHEIIVVDGDSTDATVRTALEHVRSPKVLHQNSKGKGGALSLGFANATGDLVAIIDADGSMDPSELNSFLAKFPDFDIVKGSRYLKDAGSDDLTFIRSIGNKTLTKIANSWFDQEWTDMAYGYAVFKNTVIHELALTNYDRLGSFFGHKSYGQGFEIETLMFVRAAKRKYKIIEVPSFEAERISGSSNLRAIRDGFRVLITMIVENHRHFQQR